jgi:non-specific serine/threonine protein kinase/serine/threonine-protein kinase
MAKASNRPRGGRLTPRRRRLLDQLFDQALEHEGDDRQAYVRKCLQRAPRLGFWLERLLAAGASPDSAIDRSARGLVGDALAERTDLFPRTLVRGTRMGPWRILARIGAGGMGEVYHAERADGAFQMQVAIKLIRSRRDNLARLLKTERELLARLNHPGIARLIDGGMADDDRPFLVMEWVDGRTLGEWIHGSDVRSSTCLDIFAQVCEAVAFAHRSLIVHGDIKPANVAVGRDGQARLLDFGVAQLLDATIDSRMPSAMTPNFSAPEQLRGEPVSTSSDIFSLGAVLRWMLRDPPPADAPEARPGLRSIWRGFRRLADLEAVVARATADSPEQRYPTVNALLQEIERLQHDRPVQARRLSPLAVLSLWARRHRATALIGSLAALLLVGGVSGLVWQSRVVAQERDVARHEADVTLAVKDRLVVLFREVSQLSASEELSARELLDETAVAAEDWLQNDPETLLEIRLALAEILISLDDWAAAEPMLTESLARLDQVDDEFLSSPALRAKLKHNLALVRHRQGAIDEGFELADEAVNLIESFPGDHRERLSNSLQTRGRLKRMKGDWEGAVDDLRRARSLAQSASTGPRPMLAWAESNLAATYIMGGKFHDAVRHMEAAEALWLSLGRGESPDAMSNLQNLAVVLDRLGRADEAAGRFERIIELRRERLGESGALAAAMTQYARLLLVRGDLDRADTLLTSARGMMERFVGDGTPDYASTLIGQGELALIKGDQARADQAFAGAEAIFTQTVGDGHPYTLLARLGRASAEALSDESGQLRSAHARLGELIEGLRASGPVARSFLAQALCERAVLGYRLGIETAGPDADECLTIRQSLSLGGWRLHEAQALDLLIRGERQALSDVLATLNDEMAATHPRLRWLEEAASARLASDL